MRWATRNPTIPTCKARPDSRYSSAPNKRCTLATHSMKSIYSIGEVEQLVKQGHSLVIAGEEGVPQTPIAWELDRGGGQPLPRNGGR